jgi:hypothetical protein
MTLYWFLCRSLTHAQRAAAALERGGITASITKAPQGSNPKGCGYAVLVRNRLAESARILRDRRIPFERIVRRLEDGSFQEVLL